MSKKQIHSRLESLFSNLADDEFSSSQPGEPTSGNGAHSLEETNTPEAMLGQQTKQSTGWAWEADSRMRYVFCGPEVRYTLGVEPAHFLEKEICECGIHPGSREALENAFHGSVFPVEVRVEFEDPQGVCVPVRMHVLARLETGGETVGWRGFAQRILEAPLQELQTTKIDIEAVNQPQTEPQPPAAAKRNGTNAKHNGGPKAAQTPADTPHTPEAFPAGGVPMPKNGKQHAKETPTPASAADFASTGNARRADLSGYALEQGQLRSASQVWTKTGQHSLVQKEMSLTNATEDSPATIAFPLQMKGVGDLLLEIVDDGEREWSDDDRFLVMEVASQLSLALDNAQLYINVQQELADRIRAEQAILRRNKDLAALNRVGHQLSRLASREEIYSQLAGLINEVLKCEEMYICAYHADKNLLSFPVVRVDGMTVERPERVFGSGLPEYVMREQSPLMVGAGTADALAKFEIETARRAPASVLAIPMIAGERALGAIVALDYERENAFDAIQLELLSTAASQATTAIENTDLFQQMQNALNAIENRERYQANVARSAAVLTEFGTKSMADVLKALGQAAECSRVYFAQMHEDERGGHWTATADWTDPSVAYLFDKTRLQHLPVQDYPAWSQGLREKGWVITQTQANASPEARLLDEQQIHTSLLLAVPSQMGTPHFVAFDQLGSPREWLNEEISVLRVSADAISNTFVREGLLDQLQVTLDETEGLYKASNRLAAANDMQEMVAAVLSGVRAPEINRAVMLLF